MIKFEKVSYEQWAKDMHNEYGDLWGDEVLRACYDEIKLPTRGTKKSAGYDFFSPIPFTLMKPKADQPSVLIPTGIRVKMDDDVVLKCYPRSGQGFKCGVELANTTGIIDADYYDAENEGHILAKLVRKSFGRDEFVCSPGQAFMQGIFSRYLLTDDDDADGERTGGFGSTDKGEKQ